jgi:hypothetical protein
MPAWNAGAAATGSGAESGGEMSDDFSDLKPGDKVIVKRGWGMVSKRIGAVEKVGKTHITVEGRKFRVQGGYQSGDGYERGFLERATPELMAEVAHAVVADDFQRAIAHAGRATIIAAFSADEMNELVKRLRAKAGAK